MCFHASRFGARQASEDSFILYEQQNKNLWNTALINQGWHFLDLSARGDEMSSYHLEARIASWHCIKEDTKEKWENVLQLYNQLLLVNYSPSVTLHRVFALYQVNTWPPGPASAERLPQPSMQGQQTALAEAEKLKVENNDVYFVLLG